MTHEMSSLKKSTSMSSSEKGISAEQEQDKVNEVREILGPLAAAMPNFVTDAIIRRFLRLKGWNSQKASKLMKEAVKWRLDYKPEAIRWEDVAQEAETGTIYRADYLDKQGRTVLVIRPGFQKKISPKGQMRCFIYHLEKVMMSMPAGQEQIVWLTDFHGWTLASTPLKISRASLYILQNYYPGMLGLVIGHNPPKLFQSFWKILKAFIDNKTYERVKFVYSSDLESQKAITDNFDVEVIEEAYGGKNHVGFDIDAYGKKMREEDKKVEEARQKAAAAHGVGSTAPGSLALESLLKEAQPCALVAEAEDDDSAEPLSLDDLKVTQN